LAHIQSLLTKQNIEVIYDVFAQEITPTQIQTTQGTVDSDITILTAGVRANTDFLKDVLPLDAQGNVRVTSALTVEGLEHVYALGDVIAIDAVPAPKLAQTAVQEACVVAENIVLSRRGESLKTYQPVLKGFLLSLGYAEGRESVWDGCQRPSSLVSLAYGVSAKDPLNSK
jgi:NADH dehydrogenase FAD-containing subunit